MKFRFVKRFYSKSFDSANHIEDLKKISIKFPRLTSIYHDKVFQKYIKSLKPDNYQSINNDLQNFQSKLNAEYYELHHECNSNPPYLKKFDAFGNRIDEIVTCSAWRKLKQISAEEGLVAIPYENKYREESRIYQGLKLILFNPFSGLFSCPLAMTDGAAFIIKNSQFNTAKELQEAYTNLTSRDATMFWTSGQWMTEKQGGSDVAAATDTVALPCNQGEILKEYQLYGYKWFSSATDSDMAFTLARSLNEQTGLVIKGNKGLSLYFLRTRVENDISNNLNGIEVVTLKDKLGTRQLPTAELILHGSRALRVSEVGRGIPSISGMLTITRIHNALSAVSYMRHIYCWAREYAQYRSAFGTAIINHPLHAKTLVHLDTESRAGFYLVMDILKYLGRIENQPQQSAAQDEVMLRILSPLVKLYTGKQAVSVISEALECFGGLGYLENSGLPGLLRDAQVLTIWEGTTNILSLDLLRALSKNSLTTLSCFHNVCRQRIYEVVRSNCDTIVRSSSTKLEESLDVVVGLIKKHAESSTGLVSLDVISRELAYALTRIYMGILLLEHGASSQADETDLNALVIWITKDLTCGLSRYPNNIDNIDWVKHLKLI